MDLSQKRIFVIENSVTSDARPQYEMNTRLMKINRPNYLSKLISLKGNGMIKVVTGMRRCGKSFLLYDLFATELLNQGVERDCIVEVNFESYRDRELRDPDALYQYVQSRISDERTYYLLFDEVQMLKDFQDVLNGFLTMGNVDIYVTGSNARFLSKDIATEFRGRGFEVRMYPLSFSEFMSVYEGSKSAGLKEYMLYGGLPQIVSYQSEVQKSDYLKALFDETYIRDIQERYNIRKDDDLKELINILASGIGSLTNPNNLANTFRSVKKSSITYDTVSNYVDYLCDSFLIESAIRYDIKGKRYISSPCKYYFMDLGLRNARLNFRQTEWTHLMENLIYNELRMRGLNVDVGSLSVVRRDDSGAQQRSTLEIDFVCNQGSKRYYLQSAYRLPTEEKVKQEKAPLLAVDDSFKKIVISGEETPVLRSESGITTISIYDFLLNPESLEL